MCAYECRGEMTACDGDSVSVTSHLTLQLTDGTRPAGQQPPGTFLYPSPMLGMMETSFYVIDGHLDTHSVSATLQTVFLMLVD